MNRVFIAAFMDELEKLSFKAPTVAGKPGTSFISADSDLAKDIPPVPKLTAPLTNLIGIGKSKKNPLGPQDIAPPVMNIPPTADTLAALDTSGPMGEQQSAQADLKKGLSGRMPPGNTSPIKVKPMAKATGDGAAVTKPVASSSAGSRGSRKE